MKPLPLCVTAALLALGTLLILYPSADAYIHELPLPQRLRDCYERAENFTCSQYVGYQYSWYCESPNRHSYNVSSLTPQQNEYISGLYNVVEENVFPSKRKKRQTQRLGPRCMRRECRMLEDDQRLRLFAAFNALKNDRSVEPNLYDSIAAYHRGINNARAHRGPGFYGWHRIYLLMLEEALRQKDPSVCLCYWDSTLDAALTNPASSYLWDDDFFGNGQGAVTTGPFANWITLNNVPLTRSVGVDGQPMRRRDIQNVLSRTRYEEIVLLQSEPPYNLEFHHGNPHMFVGGDMESLGSAANDPIFFLHHAYIDYIFELFRARVSANGQNPEAYPSDSRVGREHRPNAPTGFGSITHREGYGNVWLDSFGYEPSPVCSRNNPDCNSRYLFCNTRLGQCVPTRPRRSKRASDLTQSSTSNSTSRHNPSCKYTKPQAYQNNFCINGKCDDSQWVWLPVKIVSQRPPEFSNYRSYRVHKNKIDTESDIYTPSAYAETRKYFEDKPKPKTYDNCKVEDGVGRIMLSSRGLNYEGFYKESAIIDQRLATAISIAYIAVKDPGYGTTEVILRAHDQCGRICQTACRVPGSSPARYDNCSGVVAVNSQPPLMYGQTYAAATLMAFDYAANPRCPEVNFNQVFITFFCDYTDFLPWVGKKAAHKIPAPTWNSA